MNLAYIINTITAKNSSVPTTHHTNAVATADGASVLCSGYGTMALSVTSGNSTARTYNIFVEGRTSASVTAWRLIPVSYNGAIHPYICIKNARLNTSGDGNSIYFANINGFTEVRARLEFVAGASITIASVVTNSQFLFNNSGAIKNIRNAQALTSILIRDTEYIGRLVGSTDGGLTDPAQVFPIWFGKADFCEVVLINNTNKVLNISELMLYDDIASSYSQIAYIYTLTNSIAAGNTLRINSIDYPMLLTYGGLALKINQIDRLVGDATSGTYSLKVNIK